MYTVNCYIAVDMLYKSSSRFFCSKLWLLSRASYDFQLVNQLLETASDITLILYLICNTVILY